jgi:hypothetical protein
MTDLEMTRLCAEAMGWHTGKLASKVVCYDVSKSAIIAGNDRGGESVWQPLHDDAQAMALVKKFHLCIDICDGDDWMVTDPTKESLGAFWRDENLNRAICLCVAAK